MMSESPFHQVLVIGGGLVGSSLAIALNRVGLDIALVDASAPGALPAVFDQRNLSFAEAAVQALSALDILSRLDTPGGAIRRIEITRQGDFGRIWLHASDYGRAEFGQVVVARDFGDALESALVECTHLTRYRPAQFIGFGTTCAAWREVIVRTDAGEYRIRARLVVAADGTWSAVRSALGIGTDEYDYCQRLFIARLRAAQRPDGTAFERLTAHGPTALLPRGDGDWGLVHAVDEGEAGTVLALSHAAFLERVQRVLGWRVGKLLEIGPRSAHPARNVIARRTYDHRVALVGNAAQTLHPIGAQGFNLGLRDALILAEGVANAEDPGHADVLQVWATQRAEDRQLTTSFSDGLARLTANPSMSLRLLRSLGLAALDRLPVLQTRLVTGAMGYRGHSPELCLRPLQSPPAAAVSGSGRPTRHHRHGLRDVVIVGAGVVGASCALALAQAGLDVTLLEASAPPPWDAEVPDLRVYAIAPDNAALLERLGIWPQIRCARAQAYRTMRVWDAGGGGELAFDANHLGRPELGWIVESSLLLDRLWAALPHAGVDVRCPARVESLQQTPTQAQLRLSDGRHLDARLVIAADGVSSSIRALAGIKVNSHHYHQRSIVGYIHSEHPHQYTAWQRFLPGGPLALLPCPGDGHLLSIVWTLPDADAARILGLDDAAFARELTIASQTRLGALRPASKRAAFALKRQLVQTQHTGRLLVIGDAAHAVHPLAGQGVNLGLRDVVALSSSIRDALTRQLPWDRQGRLARWARTRRSDNTLAAYTFDTINRIFSNDAVVPTLLRGHLLSVANCLPGMSFLLGRRAVG